MAVNSVAVGIPATWDPPGAGNESRTGLQMIPTCSLSSLPFRKAAFHRYGWRAGKSGGVFRALLPLKPAPSIRWRTLGFQPTSTHSELMVGNPARCRADGSVVCHLGRTWTSAPRGPAPAQVPGRSFIIVCPLVLVQREMESRRFLYATVFRRFAVGVFKAWGPIAGAHALPWTYAPGHRGYGTLGVLCLPDTSKKYLTAAKKKFHASGQIFIPEYRPAELSA